MHDPIPGQWPELTAGQYERLVQLARRRLVGHELHAEDVVSRAVIRWQALPKGHPTARIETLIRSEAYSLLRSEHRRSGREHRAASDRSRPADHRARPADDDVIFGVRLAAADAAASLGVRIGPFDMEVFELLCAGYSLADVVRLTGVPRHLVKRSRLRWRVVLRAIVLPDVAGPADARAR